MKKNTLIKILCVALVCVMVLPLVLACNNDNGPVDTTPKFKVHFDAKGGTMPKGFSEEIEVNQMGTITRLPIPTRRGYKFIGWFEEDDTTFQYQITKRDPIMYETWLVAKWEKDDTIKFVTLEYDLQADEEMDSETVFEYISGEEQIGDMPTPERDGYKFLGWYDSNGKKYTKTSVLSKNTVVKAKWELIVYCEDGTENHDWQSLGGWKTISEATCEDAMVRERTCGICGHIERATNGDPLGHNYKWNTDTPMQRTGVCTRCPDTVAQEYVNVTNEAMGKTIPTITSEAGWGFEAAGSLIDNNWTSHGYAGNQKPVTVTLTFEKVTYVDLIYVAGKGSAGYNITWYDADGEEVGHGIGGFGNPDDGTHVREFEVGAEIAMVEIYMPACSNGSDVWSEVCLARYPEEE